MQHFPVQVQENKKNLPWKKFLTFPQIELSSSNVTKVLIFSQKNAFLIFSQMNSCTFQSKPKKWKKSMPRKISYILWNRNLEKNFLYFRNGTFLYFGKWNFWAPSLNNFLYFKRELAKPEIFFVRIISRIFYMVGNKLRLLFFFNNIFTFF